MAHRIQESTLLLSIYYTGYSKEIAERKRCYKVRNGREGAWSFHALFGCANHNQHLSVFSNQEGLQNPSIKIFMGISLSRHDWLNHWLLVINPTSNPSPLPRVWRVGLQDQPSIHMVSPSGNQSPSSQSDVIRISARMIKGTYYE